MFIVIARQSVLSILVTGSLLLAACGGGAATSSAPAAAPSVTASKPAASVAASAAVSKPAASASAKPVAASGAAASGASAPTGVTITMVAPKDGSSVPPGDVTVNYDVAGVTLVPAADAKKLDDYHVHVLLDSDATPYLTQFLPVPMGNDNIVHTAAKMVTFKGVTAGPHTLSVFLTTSNHISVSPPIQTKATFTAQ